MRLIEITVCVPCNNRCSYCPQDILEKKYKGVKSFTLQTFKKLLINIPLDVILVFAGYCEPFQNPEVVDMLEYAYRVGYKIKVFTTFVSYNPEYTERLKKIKFERFYHHKIGQFGNYPFVTDGMTDEEYKPFITSRAGLLWEVPRKDIFWGCKAEGSCSNAVVLPNGNTYCCMDYGLTRNLGNLFKIHFDQLHKLTEMELCHYCELNGKV